MIKKYRAVRADMCKGVRPARVECRVSEIRIVGSEESRSHIPDVGMAQNRIVCTPSS